MERSVPHSASEVAEGGSSRGAGASVVIPCAPGERHLVEQLRALADQPDRGTFEVIVALNAESDAEGIEGIATSCLSDARVVLARGRRSAGHARNVGAAAASGDVLLFLDADDVAAPGYVAAMTAALQDNELTCSRMELAKLNAPWLQQIRGDLQSTELMAWLGNIPVPAYGAGATLGVTKRLFQAIGGFDEQLVASEEADFCWRALTDENVAPVLVTDAVLHYRLRESWRAMFRQERQYGRSEVTLYRRYRGGLMPVLTARQQLGMIKQLLRQALRVGSRPGRAAFVSALGHRLGRLEGSLSERTVLL